MEFKLEKDMGLNLLKNKSWVEVELKPCFPLSHKEKYFSIRDKEGMELEFLEDLITLDEVNRQLLEKYLHFKAFKFEITGVYQIEEDFGVRHFEVKTKQGDRNFQTSLENWPTQQDDGSVLIEDIYGDQYLVRSLDFGEKMLSSYID